jgi:hypothetical protein
VIGGISSQVGFTEEKSDLFALRPSPDQSSLGLIQGFDRALERASRPPSADSEAQPHAARRRALFQEREEEPGDKDQEPFGGSPWGEKEKVAGAEGKKLPAQPAPEPSRDTIQTRAPSLPLDQAEQAIVYPDGTVLEDPEVNPEQVAQQAQAAHLSGLGLVDYQQSSHGLGEDEAAAEAGLMAQPQPRRAQSADPRVAALAVEPGALLEQAEPEEQLPVKTAREQLQELVNGADPEELSDQAKESSGGRAESKGDPGRLALLNAMRQPPPGAHPARTGAFEMESGRGLIEPKGKGESSERGRSAIQHTPHEPSQAPPFLPHLASPERAAFASLQRPDRSEHPLMERVAQEVRWLIRNNRSEATIRLEPDHLGSMRIKVVHTDGTLRIEMTVDNQQARHLIESRMSDLQQRLNLQELGAEQFAFHVNVQERGGWDVFQQAAHTARAMPYLPASREPVAAEVAMPAGLSRPIWGRAGVGIYV